MCIICNGASYDELRFYIHGLIERVGWAVVPVDGCCRAHSWAYTIGLTRHDHPEISVVGLAPQFASDLLDEAARLVVAGADLTTPGRTIAFRGRFYRFAQVDTQLFETDTFALWIDYYGSLGPPHPQPRAIEIFRNGQYPKFAEANGL